jgi:hypothetical protein
MTCFGKQGVSKAPQGTLKANVDECLTYENFSVLPLFQMSRFFVANGNAFWSVNLRDLMSRLTQWIDHERHYQHRLVRD